MNSGRKSTKVQTSSDVSTDGFNDEIIDTTVINRS